MDDQDYATVSGTRVARADFAYAPPGSKPSEWKLPIHDASHTRNALARYNQTDLPADAKPGVWKKIVAAAKKFGIEVDGKVASDQWQVVSQDSSLATRHLSLVKDGLVRIALCYTNSPGTKFEQSGQKFTITEQDLEDMQKNLAEREVPIDYDHLSAAAHAQPPGWAKAAGWLVKPDTIEPFTEGRKILYGWARFTPAMLAMVKQREYRYGSIDFRWRDKNEEGENVGTQLHAFAMTNRPFLKDLPPIELSDEDYNKLFGIAPREDGRLAAITLSEVGAIPQGGMPLRLLTTPEAVHVPAIIGGKQNDQTGDPAVAGSPLQEKAKGGTMAKYAFIKSPTSKGTFAMKKMDDGQQFDDIGLDDVLDALADDLDDLLSKRGFTRSKQAAEDVGPAAAGALPSRESRSAGPGAQRAPLQITEEKKPAAALFSEVASAEGRLDRIKAARLTDSGSMTHESFVRIDETARKVETFIESGKILPKRRKEAMALALADSAAFDALLSDSKPVVDTSVKGVSRPAEGGAAKLALDSLVQQRMAATKESIDQALSEVLNTPEGKALWEQQRLDELEASAREARR
jgi:hypothetical protein